MFFRRKKKRSPPEDEVEEPEGVVEVSPEWLRPIRPSGAYQSGEAYPKKLNESVFELYAPKSAQNVDIVFFHGLAIGEYRNAYVETWKTGPICWPQEWLPLDFPKARVLAISYDSSARRSEVYGRMDLPKIGEMLIEDVIVAAGVGATCPVILVGHSLGGIVIKQLCLEANERLKLHRFHRNREIKRFLKHIKGIFYFSVPHGGSNLANIAKSILPNPGPLLNYLTTLSIKTADINEAFVRLRASYKWRATGVCESLATRIGVFPVLVVTEVSASRDVDSFVLLRADHFSICKPENERSPSYVLLLDFLGR